MGNKVNDYLQTTFCLNDSSIFLILTLTPALITIYIFHIYSFIPFSIPKNNHGRNGKKYQTVSS